MERRKASGGVLIHEEMLTTPRYASMAADFMKSTGYIGQFQALEMDQSEGFARVWGQKNGTWSVREGPCDVGHPPSMRQ